MYELTEPSSFPSFISGLNVTIGLRDHIYEGGTDSSSMVALQWLVPRPFSTRQCVVCVVRVVCLESLFREVHVTILFRIILLILHYPKFITNENKSYIK